MAASTRKTMSSLTSSQKSKINIAKKEINNNSISSQFSTKKTLLMKSQMNNSKVLSLNTKSTIKVPDSTVDHIQKSSEKKKIISDLVKVNIKPISSSPVKNKNLTSGNIILKKPAPSTTLLKTSKFCSPSKLSHTKLYSSSELTSTSPAKTLQKSATTSNKPCSTNPVRSVSKINSISMNKKVESSLKTKTLPDSSQPIKLISKPNLSIRLDMKNVSLKKEFISQSKTTSKLKETNSTYLKNIKYVQTTNKNNIKKSNMKSLKFCESAIESCEVSSTSNTFDRDNNAELVNSNSNIEKIEIVASPKDNITNVRLSSSNEQNNYYCSSPLKKFDYWHQKNEETNSENTEAISVTSENQNFRTDICNKMNKQINHSLPPEKFDYWQKNEEMSNFEDEEIMKVNSESINFSSEFYNEIISTDINEQSNCSLPSKKFDCWQKNVEVINFENKEIIKENSESTKFSSDLSNKIISINEKSNCSLPSENVDSWQKNEEISDFVNKEIINLYNEFTSFAPNVCKKTVNDDEQSNFTLLVQKFNYWPKNEEISNFENKEIMSMSSESKNFSLNLCNETIETDQRSTYSLPLENIDNWSKSDEILNFGNKDINENSESRHFCSSLYDEITKTSEQSNNALLLGKLDYWQNNEVISNFENIEVNTNNENENFSLNVSSSAENEETKNDSKTINFGSLTYAEVLKHPRKVSTCDNFESRSDNLQNHFKFKRDSTVSLENNRKNSGSSSLKSEEYYSNSTQDFEFSSLYDIHKNINRKKRKSKLLKKCSHRHSIKHF